MYRYKKRFVYKMMTHPLSVQSLWNVFINYPANNNNNIFCKKCVSEKVVNKSTRV